MKKRNYLIDSIVKTKALPCLIIYLMSMGLYMILDVLELRYTTSIISTGKMDNLKILLIISVGIVVVDGISTITNCENVYSYNYLANKLTTKILNLDYSVFSKWSPAELLLNFDRLESLVKSTKHAVALVRSIIIIIVYIIAIIVIDKIVILPIILFYIIGGILLKVVLKRWISIESKITDLITTRNSEVDDIVNGFSEVRAYNNESIHEDSLFNLNKSILKTAIRKRNINFMYGIVFEVMIRFINISIVLYAILMMQTKGVAPTMILNIIMFTMKLLEPINIVVDVSSDLSTIVAKYPKFKEIMDYENTVSEGTIDLDSFKDSIELRDVSFSYDKSTKIITDINLKIKKGQRIGICGSTGGGKSTLLKLFPKYYDPDDGAVFIDGIDLRSYTKDSVRRVMGIIHQDPYIFNDTILNNILYANKNASMQQVIDACKKASIYEFILSLEEKFETNVGPRGLKLSGGQKQRIAMARLILKNPEIIILDEATSALDNETERAIQDSLKMFNDRTQIVVAHRLSTIKDSDKIIVIDNHRIIEEGNHDELLKLNGTYARLYNAGIE